MELEEAVKNLLEAKPLQLRKTRLPWAGLVTKKTRREGHNRVQSVVRTIALKYGDDFAFRSPTAGLLRFSDGRFLGYAF